MDPCKFILLCLAGWINREQQAVIEYLQEEIRVLKEIHGRPPRFTDRQRRRLAAKAKKLRFGRLKEVVNLGNPGDEISRDTVANILKDYGIEPAPERGPRTTWADFLRRHWEVTAATDFFTVEDGHRALSGSLCDQVGDPGSAHRGNCR